jgi:hypothetical protein
MLAREIRVFGLTLMCATAIRAQPAGKGEIRGLITDSSGAPLAGVEILIANSDQTARSNERGQFRLMSIDFGRHVVVARRAGFSPDSLVVRVDSDRPQNVQLALLPVTVLSDVEVYESRLSARVQGFEDRRLKRNGGQFITRREIESRSPVVTADLLRRMQGIRMVDSAGVTVAISRLPKVNKMTVTNCMVRVGVDGSVKEHGFPVNLIPPEEIYGIEVYTRSGQLPPEFNSARKDSYCGLIMIWTRSY